MTIYSEELGRNYTEEEINLIMESPPGMERQSTMVLLDDGLTVDEIRSWHEEDAE